MNLIHEIEKEILNPKEGFIFVRRIEEANLIANVVLNKIDELGFELVKKEVKE
jgi:hypothetical protein